MSNSSQTSMTGSAVIECPYRYELRRKWSEDGPTAVWIMLNPSTADANQDDPTIRRCIGFSKREGCGGLRVVNLFAYRSTDPRGLLSIDDPIGPRNSWFIQTAMLDVMGPVVAAWGAGVAKVTLPSVTPRLDIEGLALKLGRDLTCLGTTKDGHPRHPLMVPSKQPLVPFRTERTG